MSLRNSVNTRLIAKTIFLSSLSLLLVNLPTWAIDSKDDVGVYGSITTTRLAREAAKAAGRNDWPSAVNYYRQAIAQSADQVDFYYGLYDAATHANDWAQASYALESLFEKDPEAKSHLQAEYGQVLTYQNRFDEAIPVLKNALKTADADAAFLPTKLREVKTRTATVVEAPKRELTAEEKARMVAEVTPRFIPKREMVHGEDVREDKSDLALTYENAFNYSEFIGLCTYEGFDKEVDTSFYHPPISHFHIDKVIKGPPLNRSMPLRFEFHDKTGDPMPKDWKFGPDKMPAKGSKWLIFIANAVPINGAFETYHGSYGRQAMNDENLNKIYSIIELHRGQQ
jgi:tetratricopeptide (TPR) repeat protein